MAQIVEMPKLGFDMAEGTLVRWVKTEGETIQKGQVLAEIETDKATVEVESNFDGIVRHHLVEQGKIVPVGTPIAVIGSADEAIDLTHLLGSRAGQTPTTPEQPAPSPQPAAATPKEGKIQSSVPLEGGKLPAGVKASPLARSMARVNAIDLSAVKGTGPAGRIVKRDVEVFLQTPAAASQTLPAWQPPASPIPDKYVPLSRLRSAIGRRMSDSKQNAPHFYVTHQYDVATLMALREQFNALIPEDEKVSVNDFLVKAVALTLRQYPNLNAALEKDNVRQFGSVHIGVAVAVEGGLLTVVCRNADQKNLRQISAEVRSMAGRARAGKIRPEDIGESTFSISNLGMFDVEEFAAIINPPETAVLAVGSVKEVPVIVDGEVKSGLRMKATLSVDHRVSDGAEAARFLQSLAEPIQTPLSLLL
jgi:pyruvate dehydrogenase E2 component (dihydrolipoamide acetyltransferase)